MRTIHCSPLELPLRDASPWLFRLARGMVRRRVWGGYHLVELLEVLGWLDCRAMYRLSDRIALELPMWRRPNQLDLVEALGYEAALVSAVIAEVAAFALPALLVDCGADVGLLAGLLVAGSRRIEEVVAIEPNGEAFALLERNVARWPVVGRSVQAAVADFTGRGRLVQPGDSDSPHARFIEQDDRGDVVVTRIDDLRLDVGERCLVLKLDIEGGELAAVRGALETLSAARRWIVTVEAHRQVYARTGIDPLAVVRLLESVRPCRVRLAERPTLGLNTARPYFDQVDEPAIGNLVCVSE